MKRKERKFSQRAARREVFMPAGCMWGLGPTDAGPIKAAADNWPNLPGRFADGRQMTQ